MGRHFLQKASVTCEMPLVHQLFGIAAAAALGEGAAVDSTLKLGKCSAIHGVLKRLMCR